MISFFVSLYSLSVVFCACCCCCCLNFSCSQNEPCCSLFIVWHFPVLCCCCLLLVVGWLFGCSLCRRCWFCCSCLPKMSVKIRKKSMMCTRLSGVIRSLVCPSVCSSNRLLLFVAFFLAFHFFLSFSLFCWCCCWCFLSILYENRVRNRSTCLTFSHTLLLFFIVSCLFLRCESRKDSPKFDISNIWPGALSLFLVVVLVNLLYTRITIMYSLEYLFKGSLNI